jgi:uncharacterized protein (TIGR00730 family)
MLDSLRSVCVYCGSKPGADPRFGEVARQLGKLIADRGLRLVYGGGHVGLMAILADAVLGHGGEVHGVITRNLRSREEAHTGLAELEIVETMHERKARMSDLADGFLMLPGGFGTLDEYFEALTWTQLGIHSKPCAILNVDGYFDSLITFVTSATDLQFIRPEHREIMITGTDPGAVLDQMSAWRPPRMNRWLTRNDR